MQACAFMNRLSLPVRFHTFDTGVKVMMAGNDLRETLKDVENMVAKHKSLRAEQYAQLCGIPVLLAKERLLAAESSGSLCRDETVEGLQFYPNLFLKQS